jgi:hypothetical protein
MPNFLPAVKPSMPAAAVLVGTLLICTGALYSCLRSEIPAAATDYRGKNACALLSVQELSSGMGVSYAPPQPETNGADETVCNYPPGPNGIYGAKLTVTFRHGKAAMETLKGAGPLLVSATRSASQLGDACFFLPMDVSIYTLRGDTLVAMDFGLISATRDQKIALLRKVLARL